MNPTFDVNEQLASVVFSHVTDVSNARRPFPGELRVAQGVESRVFAAGLRLDFNLKMLEWYKKGARHGNTECEMI